MIGKDKTPELIQAM